MMDKTEFDAILLVDLDEEQKEEVRTTKLYLSLWLQCFTWDSMDFQLSLEDGDFQYFFLGLCRRHYLN